MTDELDPQLLRWFAQSREPLTDAQFTAQVAAQLRTASGVRLSLSATRGIIAAIVAGLTTGIGR